MNLFAHIFASRRKGQPSLVTDAGASPGSEHAPGDCFPDVILSGRFHADGLTTPWGQLSPGKVPEFTPARTLDSAPTHTGAREAFLMKLGRGVDGYHGIHRLADELWAPDGLPQSTTLGEDS